MSIQKFNYEDGIQKRDRELSEKKAKKDKSKVVVEMACEAERHQAENNLLLKKERQKKMKEDLEDLIKLKQSNSLALKTLDKLQEMQVIENQRKYLDRRIEVRNTHLKEIADKTARLQNYFANPEIITLSKVEGMKTRYIE